MKGSHVIVLVAATALATVPQPAAHAHGACTITQGENTPLIKFCDPGRTCHWEETVTVTVTMGGRGQVTGQATCGAFVLAECTASALILPSDECQDTGAAIPGPFDCFVKDVPPAGTRPWAIVCRVG